MSAATGISVVVASYRRTDRLAECLAGLRRQTCTADEVLVVVHASDAETADYVSTLRSEWASLCCVRADRHGSVAAYNRGLAAAREAIVAYIDDDAVPATDWLERIVRTFEQDGRIAGVGGRDVIVEDRSNGLRKPTSGAPQVGRIQWFGRMIANHHLGFGAPRDVDVLKGVNMSFRRSAVVEHGFDERLLGRGALVHSELSICLPLRRRGLRVVYDPNIEVTHFPAPRPAGDHRHRFDADAVAAAAHNEALAILDFLGPVRRVVFLLWGAAIGTTDSPGVAVLIRDLLKRRQAALRRLQAAQRGRAAALRTRRSARRTSPAVLGDQAALFRGDRQQASS